MNKISYVYCPENQSLTISYTKFKLQCDLNIVVNSELNLDLAKLLPILIQNIPPMNINFEYDHVKASDRLEIMVGKKLEKLEDKYDFIIRADVFFKTENTSEQDTGKICGIRLSIPGPRLFAETSSASYEAAIAASIEDLERQLRKRKAKMKRSLK